MHIVVYCLGLLDRFLQILHQALVWNIEYELVVLTHPDMDFCPDGLRFEYVWQTDLLHLLTDQCFSCGGVYLLGEFPLLKGFDGLGYCGADVFLHLLPHDCYLT